MFRYLIALFLILVTDFSFGQIVLTQTHNDATIGLDRKAWNGLGNTSIHSDGYAHDFTLPLRTNPCEQITGITVEVNYTGYTNNNACPHYVTYYNQFYGCTTYAGGATCLPATNLIAEPNYPPNTNPPPFVYGNPLGSPLNSNIVPDFGDNLSFDIVPVSDPGCNPVTNGHISHQYTITVTVTISNTSPTSPTFTQVPAICSGDTLSALPTTSNNSITGTWSPALDNTATTTYTFTPDAGQCASTQTMTITVNPPVTPTFTQVPAICSGDTLSALPTTSNNSITGTWSPALDNTATTTYTFTPDAGQCASTQTMTITVNPSVTPTFTQISAICAGDTLSALPTTSNNSITGTWSPALDNTTTTTYTFTPDAGQCASTQTMTVTVNPSVTPTFTQVSAICNGDTLSALPTISNNSITGTWSPALDNTATTTYTFTPDAGQCASSQTMTITVNPTVTPTFTQVSAICAGDTLSALPTTSNNSITGTWSPALDNTATTTYTFTPDAGQCASTQTMTITVNPSVTPTFTQVSAICSGDTLSALPTTSNNSITGTWSPALDNTATTTYTFTPDAGQCASTQTMTITVNPSVTPAFTQISAICSGDTLSALPTTSNNSITGRWSPALDNTATTTYTFTPDAGQCASTQTMTIAVNASATPTFTQVPAICSGDTLSVLPTTSNNGVTGIWSPALNNTMTTIYTFTPDAGFCPSPVTMTIEVNENPSFSLLDEYFLCLNNSGNVVVPLTIDTGLSVNTYSFSWQLNGNVIMGANQASFMPVQGGNYGVIVQNIVTMCESSMLTVVTELSEPEFEAEVITADFSENQTIQVTTMSSGDFEYQLDDGPWQDEPVFNNVSAGEHLVTVRDKAGCIASSKTVIVINYPKFFTPNDDGYNDRWNISSIGNQANARINIFNRYGKLLKQFNPSSEGWSGLYNGRLMPMDDYWFTVDYNDANTGERKTFKAHFALKR
ncbi:hypothetical protein DIS18_05715 [Algibacter marinivivus]|uniref:Gliding motility-associated C-terminal domain-containing protein n=1 Tax=Algibacter marinivivus TaxID=2100723 RepID=A0A2U2X8H1_9FLAO|nr:T9SS type B sorting domain-containing protein [Algibacter marinivivus]PWH84043.1 hypothetical protein DIS18_05715 [Algibacter marinivivus]